MVRVRTPMEELELQNLKAKAVNSTRRRQGESAGSLLRRINNKFQESKNK